MQVPICARLPHLFKLEVKVLSLRGIYSCICRPQCIEWYHLNGHPPAPQLSKARDLDLSFTMSPPFNTSNIEYRLICTWATSDCEVG